jgi:hypothetical protein
LKLLNFHSIADAPLFADTPEMAIPRLMHRNAT